MWEKKKERRILMFGLGDNWQNVGCCLRTFMQERLFGPRRGIHLHVFDAALRLVRMSGLGSAVQKQS